MYRSILVLAAISFALCGCQTQYERNWDGLQVGMDRLEVLELLGEPSCRTNSLFRKNLNPTTSQTALSMAAMPWGQLADAVLLRGYEFWCYGPQGLHGLCENMFHPSTAAHAIAFDSDRKLAAWRKPKSEWIIDGAPDGAKNVHKDAKKREQAPPPI